MRLFVLGFVLGAWALQHAAELPSIRLDLAGAALLLGARLLPRERRVAAWIAVGASGLLMGYGWAAWRAEARLADALPFALEGEDITLTGIVAGLPQANERGVRFIFHREEGPGPRVVSLMWYAPRDAGDASAFPRVVPGERWRLTVRLKRPRGLSNPHAFDFEPWALERGIRATGYVRLRPAPERLAERVDGWPQTLHRWRFGIRDSMREDLGEARLAGVLVALAIGDQDSIAPADWQVFWRTGVGHLMSISGLHITMIAALAFACVVFAWVRVPALALRLPGRKAGLVAGVLVALAYTLLTGYQVPAQRTFCMLLIVALCVLADRHGSISRVLALAALAVLLLDPWAVLAPGFWLSFGAVAAIFYVMSRRAGRQGRLAAALGEQLAVTVAMLPMLVALFQELSLVSPLANAFAIPLVSLVVVPLTLAGAFLGIPALLEAAHAVMLACMRALEWLAAFPHAVLESHEPAAWTVAAALVGCAWLLAPRGVPLRSCGPLWVAPLFLVAPPRPAPGEAWIDMLDVGSGLALVVRTTHSALVYDAGPFWSVESDSGQRIVVPYLRGEGVRRIEGLVVTHADEDHAGGAPAVAASRQPRWLLSPLPEEHPLHEAAPQTIRCEAGVGWERDGVRFRVLHPARDAFDPGRRRKQNDFSCVLRVESAGGSALLTGDIEARSEMEMLARGADLRSDVLVVPHHGSKSSSSAAFLDAVSASVALVSVGYRNRFRHPNEAVVARYAARGIRLRRTDREGALRVVLPAETSRTVGVEAASRPVRYWRESRRSP